MGFIQRLFGGKKEEPEQEPGGIAYNIVRVDAADLSGYADALKDVYNRKIDGIILQNVVSPEALREAVAKIEAWQTDIIEYSDFGKVYGKTLIGSQPDLEFFLSQTDSYNEELARIFGKSFQSIVEPLIEQMGGGREVMTPEVEGRGRYKPCTIRYIDPGKKEMRAHVGNEFITGLPQCEHIANMVHLNDQLSYFMLMQKPDEGGELVLYDLTWEQSPQDMIEDQAFRRIPEYRKKVLRKYARQNLVMEPGEMLLFHGGRIWHRVDPVQGSQPRITIGGFVAFARDDKRIYYWS